ncbi:hypothetical protein N7478_002166 [Penicillium angulare]|uniref:uncharacterized protein n=1 Tax=Penicillium angulare TaxID=116970 RepID=UPI00253FB89B|nr:uncharacterized protein N7478_002166 [Penicillium angulare]KAJ5289136.1 hypothetical protein N7478_002166 [Penicillium angulare]
MSEYRFLTYKTDSNNAISRRRRAQRRSKIHVRQTAPKQYWHLLTPRYEMGCKRIVLDSGYLKVLGDENVHLSNERICSITENSVITENGSEYLADVIADERY